MRQISFFYILECGVEFSAPTSCYMKHLVEGSTKDLWIMVFHILIQLGVSYWPSNGLDYLQLDVGTIG